MRVCVVGAGASGLPSIKGCIENGLDVICYEKTADLGGLWNYRPGQKGIGGTVMASTVVNTSKEMMAFSDFPPPEDWANFMHHSKVNDYLHMYADRFDLTKHIKFNTTVKRIFPNGDHYDVYLDNGAVERFDKLMLCTGHHSRPQMPSMKDLDNFKGTILHAQDYRDPKGFEDKHVVIMGIGNSALDIAVDLAKVAKSVTISTRRGTWVFNRVSRGGMPYDTIFMSRYYKWVMDTIPWTVANDFMEHTCNQRMDHDVYGLRPNHRFFQQHPTVNDALANLIASGYITVTEDIESFTSDTVVMKGGRSFPCDVFIQCTGYTFDFSYLEGDIVQVQNHEVNLYKYVFPPQCENVAVIGLIQPLGSIMPISEMQARWSCAVFSGSLQLPTLSQMREDMDKKRREMKRRYFESTKHTIQVDYVRYMDELAQIVGCMPPSALEVLPTNPNLAARILMGPNAPYQYRIRGPNKWEKALETFLTVGERVKKPLKNRQCRVRRHKKRGTTKEWYRYVSMKWCMNWLFCTLVVFALFFCGGCGMSLTAYCIAMVVLCGSLSFLHLWFDLQFDMSTIL